MLLRVLLCAFLSIVGMSAHARTMTATLSLQERVPLSELAKNVLDPDSDRYEQYYTPQEILELSGPSHADYSALLNTLRAFGFTVVFES